MDGLTIQVVSAAVQAIEGFVIDDYRRLE
jgi:hypothetical protein